MARKMNAIGVIHILSSSDEEGDDYGDDSSPVILLSKSIKYAMEDENQKKNTVMGRDDDCLILDLNPFEDIHKLSIKEEEEAMKDDSLKQEEYLTAQFGQRIQYAETKSECVKKEDDILGEKKKNQDENADRNRKVENMPEAGSRANGARATAQNNGGSTKKNVIFKKENACFQEVHSFELLEESPTPKHLGTGEMSATLSGYLARPKVNTRLGKWLVAKNLNFSSGSCSTSSDIFKTPMTSLECVNGESPKISVEETQDKVARKLSLDILPLLTSSSGIDKDPEKSNAGVLTMFDEGCKEIQKSVERLSLAQRLSFLDDNHQNPFTLLLRACKQSAPSTLLDLFSQYCDPGSIEKIGEGTFGEAFRAGGRVCKVVPIDGDLVNGFVQKKSIELLEEVLLSWALNSLKGQEADLDNTCTTFIETVDVRVCQGVYDASLIKAREDWVVRHNLENDHPNEFSGEQCYVVFVLAYGGEDLESFVLSNFHEVQSLLVQVAAALAVAEAAYEFEHRDLHWGNILLTRRGVETVKFVLEGRQMRARTFGLSISIIDFTLSRINTGEAIHYLDLSNDPELFKGPRGCKQSETYRKMREVTEECWEGSFPKTNVLWLQYLVDILLQKKSFGQTSKEKRDLRSLKKRLDTCCSAKEAVADPFFSSLFIDHQ
ncbi:hypothetical protein C5167_024941 [Papaver somniferum]|uniref:non-specific serine/threonine protein kinase n=1 Tax=Papaver somniferum TaxID=3469 RepID=A0A4Y7JU14_PAPSO|nr:serine/threonine-protein kinase haspin homolog [Papaver somniferum]RZC63185.1 hypothetical protein C5167_024941 [Papaver somniferum]